MMASSTTDAVRPPLMMLRNAINKEVCIETTNGDTYVGLLKTVDAWMNITLKRSVRTTAGAEGYWSSQEVLLRGASITNVTVPEVVLDARPARAGRGRGRGGRGGGSNGAAGGSAARGRGYGGGDRGRGKGATNRGRDKASGGKRNRDE